MKEKIKVLHLEDSPRDAEMIQNRLLAGGLACDILRVYNPEGFESALNGESFDVILCDYNLPDYDGISALIAARARRPLTPVLLISGTLDEEEAVKCLQHGGTDYLLKGKLERLPAAVRRALAEAEEHRQRQRAETALRDSEAILRSFFDSAGGMRGIVDLVGDDILHISDNSVAAIFYGQTKAGPPEGESAGERAGLFRVHPPRPSRRPVVVRDRQPFGIGD